MAFSSRYVFNRSNTERSPYSPITKINSIGLLETSYPDDDELEDVWVDVRVMEEERDESGDECNEETDMRG